MSATPPLAIEGAMTIHRAAELRTLLHEQAEPQARALDLSGVTEIDCAGLQLLLALQHSLGPRGQALHITARSAVVDEVLARCGLESLGQGA